MPGVVEKMGASPALRKKLFFLVCIPLRLLLSLFVAINLSSSDLVMGAVMVFSATSIISISFNYLSSISSKSVWWKQEVHLLTSVLILAGTLHRHDKFVSLVMLADLVFGVITSLLQNPWDLTT